MVAGWIAVASVVCLMAQYAFIYTRGQCGGGVDGADVWDVPSGWVLIGAGLVYVGAVVAIALAMEEPESDELEAFLALQAAYFLLQLLFLPLMNRWRSSLTSLKVLLRLCALVQLAALSIVAVGADKTKTDGAYAVVGLQSCTAAWVTIYDGGLFLRRLERGLPQPNYTLV